MHILENLFYLTYIVFPWFLIFFTNCIILLHYKYISFRIIFFIYFLKKLNTQKADAVVISITTYASAFPYISLYLRPRKISALYSSTHQTIFYFFLEKYICNNHWYCSKAYSCHARAVIGAIFSKECK